jgi:hypothetical protein
LNRRHSLERESCLSLSHKNISDKAISV